MEYLDEKAKATMTMLGAFFGAMLLMAALIGCTPMSQVNRDTQSPAKAEYQDMLFIAREVEINGNRYILATRSFGNGSSIAICPVPNSPSSEVAQ